MRKPILSDAVGVFSGNPDTFNGTLLTQIHDPAAQGAALSSLINPNFSNYLTGLVGYRNPTTVQFLEGHRDIVANLERACGKNDKLVRYLRASDRLKQADINAASNLRIPPITQGVRAAFLLLTAQFADPMSLGCSLPFLSPAQPSIARETYERVYGGDIIMGYVLPGCLIETRGHLWFRATGAFLNVVADQWPPRDIRARDRNSTGSLMLARSGRNKSPSSDISNQSAPVPPPTTT